MFQIIENSHFIEITPIVSFGNLSEKLIINVSDRMISSVHIRDPRDDKYKKWMTMFKQFNGYFPNCKIIEVITTPSKKSASMKTITHELMYFDLNDFQNDVRDITNYIYGIKS